MLTTTPRYGARAVLGLILLVLLGLLGAVVHKGPLALDLSLAPAIRADAAGAFGALLHILNTLGEVPVWGALTVLAGVILWLTRGFEDGLLLVGGWLSGEAAAFVVKHVVNRPRPAGSEVADLIPTASFPSGHIVRCSVTLGLLVALLAWRTPARRWPAVVIVTIYLLVLGVARVASGEHWPTDVIGGYLLGGLWLDVVTTVWVWWLAQGRALVPFPLPSRGKPLS